MHASSGGDRSPGRYEVRLTQADARLIAAVTARVPVQEIPRQFSTYLDQVYAAARTGAVSLDGINVFLYRAVEGTTEIVDAAFGVGCTAPFERHGNVVPLMLPAGRIATTTHTGPYAGLRAAHQAVIGWCADQGHARTGTRWEVYDHWDPDPARLRTDVCHLLQP